MQTKEVLELRARVAQLYAENIQLKSTILAAQGKEAMTIFEKAMAELEAYNEPAESLEDAAL